MLTLKTLMIGFPIWLFLTILLGQELPKELLLLISIPIALIIQGVKK